MKKYEKRQNSDRQSKHEKRERNLAISDIKLIQKYQNLKLWY